MVLGVRQRGHEACLAITVWARSASCAPKAWKLAIAPSRQPLTAATGLTAGQVAGSGELQLGGVVACAGMVQGMCMAAIDLPGHGAPDVASGVFSGDDVALDVVPAWRGCRRPQAASAAYALCPVLCQRWWKQRGAVKLDGTSEAARVNARSKTSVAGGACANGDRPSPVRRL